MKQLLLRISNDCFNIYKYVPCRYLNIYVGMPDVEESFNVTRPVSPHEVSLACCVVLRTYYDALLAEKFVPLQFNILVSF